MRIGLAQMNIIWENKEENMLKVKKCLEQFTLSCDGHGDDVGKGTSGILFFPEMSLTGFSMNTESTAEADRSTVQAIAKLAAEYNVSVGAGWVKRCEDLCENHYSIITPGEGAVLDYAKLHPFSYSGEDKYFRGGDRLCVCSVGGMKLGVQICFDLRFPEMFQMLSDNVDLIVVPANWPEARRRHWLTLLEARAIENQCYIAGVNCCGIIGGIDYSGDSCIFAPDGSCVVETGVINIGSYNEKILIYDIENNISSYRDEFPIKADRRVDLYKTIEIDGLNFLNKS